MNPIATMRQRKSPWVQYALWVVVAVWASLALVPCATAADDVSVHGCVQCPPDASGAVGPQLVHDNVLQAVPCAADVSRCQMDNELICDSRNAQAKVKQVPGDGAAAISSTIADILVAYPDYRIGIDESTQWHGMPIPLNVLYCVYLN